MKEKVVFFLCPIIHYLFQCRTIFVNYFADIELVTRIYYS